MLSEEVDKSLDIIVLKWISKGYYTDLTEGQIRRILFDFLNPILEEIRKLEDEISISRLFENIDVDELMINLSNKKMEYIRKVSDLMRVC